jgi:hypothetical protein
MSEGILQCQKESYNVRRNPTMSEGILQCQKEYDTLVSLANEGWLAEAVETSTWLQGLLDAALPALTKAEVFSNLKV